MIKTIIRKFLTVYKNPYILYKVFFKERDIRKAKKYIINSGLEKFLIKGVDGEYACNEFDVCNIHKLIIKRKPNVVVEFGTGWSTIAITHALYMNHKEDPSSNPKLYTTDASEKWLANVKSKIPQFLEQFVDLRYSPVRATLYEGELCHFYDRVPNVSPDFLYLDGPATPQVEGEIHGIQFVKEHGQGRGPISGDPLIYESSLRMERSRNFFMLVDGRWTNVQFLRRHLKRRYRFRRNRTHSFSTFELLERP